MSKRIVLVDPSGDVLFSGVSVAQEAHEDVADLDRCPETKRSANLESGLFPTVRPTVRRSSAPALPVEEVEPSRPQLEPPSTQPEYEVAEGPETKRGERAA